MTKYNDLSAWLKAATIGGWVALVVNSAAFLYGFVQGLIGL